MTPHSPSPHPEVEILADLAEDLLGADEAAAVREHLADCAECTDTLAALAEVSLLLGETEPEPIPADVAARIDAALAAEAAGPRIQPSPQGAPLPRQPSAPPGRRAETTGPGRPRRRRVGRLLLATAVAAAGLITAATLAIGGHSDHYSTGASSAAHPAFAPTAPGGTAPEYREDQLPQEVHQLLAGQSAHPHAQSRTEGASGVPACVAAAAGHPDDSPLATGPGSYGNGRAVTVLVYRSSDAPDSLDVYLVTPDCPGATVLLHRTIPA